MISDCDDADDMRSHQLW